MGAAKFTKGFTLLLLLAASTLEVSMANEEDLHSGLNFTDWWSRFGHYHLNKTRQERPKQIAGGGSQQWHFGFNHTYWAIQNAPFHINDALVFKYDAPDATAHPHSVFLFSNYGSFLKCDMKRTKGGEFHTSWRRIPVCVIYRSGSNLSTLHAERETGSTARIVM